jgi:hypothetical protein
VTAAARVTSCAAFEGFCEDVNTLVVGTTFEIVTMTPRLSVESVPTA